MTVETPYCNLVNPNALRLSGLHRCPEWLPEPTTWTQGPTPYVVVLGCASWRRRFLDACHWLVALTNALTGWVDQCWSFIGLSPSATARKSQVASFRDYSKPLWHPSPDTRVSLHPTMHLSLLQAVSSQSGQGSMVNDWVHSWRRERRKRRANRVMEPYRKYQSWPISNCLLPTNPLSC